MTQTTIIPIASGKGGVGKTILSANLAIALARLGHPTIAIDLDLGGANLNTCLGIANTHRGIGDFLRSGITGFQDLLVRTAIPNLSFIPGDNRTPFLANITAEERERLVRHIKSLPARYVILDLGAGTPFDTLHFFGMSRNGILVTTSETMSIMNCVVFLRNFIFRLLTSAMRQDPVVLKSLIRVFRAPGQTAPITVDALLASVQAVNPELARQGARICRIFRPRIVINMADHPSEVDILPRLEATMKRGLSIAAEYWGFILHDESVRKASRNHEVLITRYPRSVASLGIERMANQIVRAWDQPFQDSLRHVRAEAERLYEMKRGHAR